MVISCKKAAYLVDKSSVETLNKHEKFALKLHTFMCKFCKNYQRDAQKLDEFLKKHFKSKSDQGLTDTEKAQIKKGIET